MVAVALVVALSSVHGDDHAYSSQHVSRHIGDAHAVYIPAHEHGHSDGHEKEHSHGHIDYYVSLR